MKNETNTERTCPKCGCAYHGRPALSRTDNETLICPDVYKRQLYYIKLYQQTNARLWRQGQKSETVIIQHIITRGTVDEKILKAITEKDKTQTALMTAVRAELEEI